MTNNELIRRARARLEHIKYLPLTESMSTVTYRNLTDAASLLEQLADRLEKLESWARPMLEQYGTELARIGEK